MNLKKKQVEDNKKRKKQINYRDEKLKKLEENFCENE